MGILSIFHIHNYWLSHECRLFSTSDPFSADSRLYAQAALRTERSVVLDRLGRSLRVGKGQMEQWTDAVSMLGKYVKKKKIPCCF